MQHRVALARPVSSSKTALSSLTLLDAQNDITGSSAGFPPEALWAPTAFERAGALEVFSEGSAADGPYVAFGKVVCKERHILWQAHICSRAFRRASVIFNKMDESPHVTLAKLERGSAEKRGNRSLWLIDGDFGPEELDVSEVVRIMNSEIRRDATVYRLHKYDAGGGEAHAAFKSVQRMFQQLTVPLGSCVDHPQMCFEYCGSLVDEATRSSPKYDDVCFHSVQTECSDSSSMKIALDGFDSCRFCRFEVLLEREHVSRFGLLALAVQHLDLD